MAVCWRIGRVIMNDKDKLIHELILENIKLKSELCYSWIPCGECEYCRRSDCYTLFWCPKMGYVDPIKDGCTKGQPKKEKING
jgi:hypothetical protein